MMREAVANAVRHASANSVTVEASAKNDVLKLEFINDGAEFPPVAAGWKCRPPSRIESSKPGGALDSARGMGITELSISLPIAEAHY